MYGIAEFNEKCCESVLGYVGKFAELTGARGLLGRHGRGSIYDESRPCVLLLAPFKQIYDAGSLARTTAYPRTAHRYGTVLSDHEPAQGLRGDH